MFNKELVAQLSSEIQERINMQMETGKMERMQKFAKEDQTIDTTGLLAFSLAEAKLYTTLFTTDFLMTLAEYEEMDEKLADGTLEMPEIDKGYSDTPLQIEPDFELTNVRTLKPEDFPEEVRRQVEEEERKMLEQQKK